MLFFQYCFGCCAAGNISAGNSGTFLHLLCYVIMPTEKMIASGSGWEFFKAQVVPGIRPQFQKN